MNLISQYNLKDGSVLVTANGYAGEDDFYAIYEIIKELVAPDHIKFGVDSMCVDGSFIKDDITVRISSESAYDYFCFLYKPEDYSESQLQQISDWITAIVEKMRTQKEPVEASDEDW